MIVFSMLNVDTHAVFYLWRRAVGPRERRVAYMHAAMSTSFGIPSETTLQELNAKWARVQAMRDFGDYFTLMDVRPPPDMYLYLTKAVDVSFRDAHYHGNEKKRTRE